MNDFTASTGVRIRLTKTGEFDGHLDFKNGPNWLGMCGGKVVQALREFFQAEADERLGRWRWPENPDYVVYPDVGATSVRVFRESTSAVGFYYLTDSGENTTENMGHAARAYFDAHPEPMPWHDAKPGEVWDVDMPDGGMRAVTFHAAGQDGSGVVFRDAFTQDVVAVNSEDIREARRIFPEVF